MPTQDPRVVEFHRLHASGIFVMPNPWDVGSAKALEQLGFPALATTSAGYAWTAGTADNGVRLEEMLAHLRTLCAAVQVPVTPTSRTASPLTPSRCTTMSGRRRGRASPACRSRTSSGAADEPLHDHDVAGSASRVARSAIDDSGTGVLLTARSEGFVGGRPDIDDTTRRLRAYAEAGADRLYAPRLGTVEQIRAVVDAAGPLPVNLLVTCCSPWSTEAAHLGVRRISVGGTLARAAWGGTLRAAT